MTFRKEIGNLIFFSFSATNSLAGVTDTVSPQTDKIVPPLQRESYPFETFQNLKIGKKIPSSILGRSQFI